MTRRSVKQKRSRAHRFESSCNRDGSSGIMDNMLRLAIRGDVEPRAVAQLQRCATAGGATAGVLCADAHVGYSQPIGGAVAYPDQISPSGVGYDIGCGNKAVRTALRTEDVDSGDVAGIMDTIFSEIEFGVGGKNREPVDHPVIDAIRDADFAPQRALADMAHKQLGTVGAGNHYVDLFAGDDGFLWVGVHFGSRGFGHKTASGFLSLAAGGTFEQRGRDGEMDAPPVLLGAGTELGQSYISAMRLAGDYAYAGRDVVVDKVLEILGTQSTKEVHNHHNFAWRERHFDTDVWVVRKGCTPAFPGQEGFVGATMGEPSVILRGTDAPDGAELLHSTVHGAGRVMSRTQAAGKFGTRMECGERDCAFWVSPGQLKHERGLRGLTDNAPLNLCPEHPGTRMLRRRGRVKEGAIDFGAVKAELRGSGIELRGGAADEAPARRSL